MEKEKDEWGVKLLPVKIGDPVRVRACKADGSVYRSWNTTIESVDVNTLVTISPAGSVMEDRVRGSIRMEHILIRQCHIKTETKVPNHKGTKEHEGKPCSVSLSLSFVILCLLCGKYFEM